MFNRISDVMRIVPNIIKWLLIFLLPSLFFFSCRSFDRKIRIGFSQCVGGEWREQMNNEILSESHFYDNVEIIIKNAGGDIKQQISDIRSLSKLNLDLLIISPLEDTVLINIFSNLENKNIPVFLIDRKISSNKYISYVGGSNIKVGEVAADYVKNLRGSLPTRIFQIKGYDKSTATFERETGFINSLKPYKNFSIYTVVAGKHEEGNESIWTKDILQQELNEMKKADVIYAFNDAIGLVAYDVLKNAGVEKMPVIIGVDGMLGYGKGIEAVKSGLLTATIVYPTCGHEAINLAMDIINKKTVPRENVMPIHLIDKSNVQTYYEQGMSNLEQQQKIELLQQKLYRNMSEKKRVFTVALIFSLTLIFIIIALVYLCFLHPHYSIRFKQLPVKSTEQKADDDFKQKIIAYTEEHYMEFDLDLSSFIDEMSMSRVHFYKKFKYIFNDTPNSFLKEYRLEKSKEFILLNQFTYAEIGYKVGFSSPAYFTKCFKDEYGETPSQYFERKNKKNKSKL